MRQSDRLAQTIAHQHAIRQAGEEIVLGRMAHLASHRSNFADVTEHDHGSRGFAFTIMNRGNTVFYGDFDAVAANQEAVGGPVFLI